MSKIDDKIAAFERRQQDERAAFNAEIEIEKHVPEGARVHIGRLWGTVGSVTYGDASGRTPATWDQIVDLVNALPPLSRVQVRDSCLSHPPAAYVASLPEEKKVRWQEETPISPVMFTIEGGHGRLDTRLSVDWYAATAAGIVRVNVEMGRPPHGVIDYSSERRLLKGRTEYGPARVSVCGDMHNARIDGESVAQLESPIRWGGSGPEYPGRISLYYMDLGEKLDPGKVGAAIVENAARLVLGEATK